MMPRRVRPWAAAEYDELLRLTAAGVTVLSIARQLYPSTDDVSKRLVALGVASAQDRSTGHRRWTAEEDEQLAEMDGSTIRKARLRAKRLR